MPCAMCVYWSDADLISTFNRFNDRCWYHRRCRRQLVIIIFFFLFFSFFFFLFFLALICILFSNWIPCCTVGAYYTHTHTHMNICIPGKWLEYHARPTYGKIKKESKKIMLNDKIRCSQSAWKFAIQIIRSCMRKTKIDGIPPNGLLEYQFAANTSCKH